MTTEIATLDDLTGQSSQNQIKQLNRVLDILTKQLARSSARLYRLDMQHFVKWLNTNGHDMFSLTKEIMVDYRLHLVETYAKVTASRMLVTLNRFLEEAVSDGVLHTNPAAGVKGIKPGNQETTHRALTGEEAKLMLTLVDTTTRKGKRDYAILLTLIKTGLRRAELAALTFGDLKQEQGHWILVIQHGKGDKRRIAKLSADCYRAIQSYIEATDRAGLPADSPLFASFQAGDKPVEEPLGVKGLEYLVKGYGKKLGGSKLTPHGLRATFVTLALEGGAKLHQVQYSAGHADPRTTERYQKRKLNLDDAATDYIKL